MEMIIGFAIAALVGFFTYKDASKRGMKATWWGIGTALSMFPVLIIYFIVRKERV
jgi:hypothetical protein